MKWFFLLALLFPAVAMAQQISDSLFLPIISDPHFETGEGPLVYLDEAHHNFHQLNGRYAPFVQTLRADGYRVEANSASFTSKSLAKCDILVIANALNRVNSNSWNLPNPSAFSPKEIKAIQQWVTDGGSLFLIADHMPFAGAASDLAAAFGFTFQNGFALQEETGNKDLFTKENGRLVSNSFTDSLQQVQTFTGQGFSCPEGAIQLLTLDSSFVMRFPSVPWQFSTECETKPANRLTQLACLPYGKGKIVVSGEAAMFSAQLANGSRIGLNSPDAKDNLTLLRILLYWLAT